MLSSFWCSLTLSSRLPIVRPSQRVSSCRRRAPGFDGWVKLGMLCLLGLAGGQRVQAQTVIATDTVGEYPSALAVNPATNTIYVSNYNSKTVSVIDGATNAVSASVTVGSNPKALAVNPITNNIYVALEGSTTKGYVINGANNATSTYTAGKDARSMVVDPVTDLMYLADTGGTQVTVIDSADASFTGAFVELAPGGVGGSTPISLAMNPVTNTIYVADSGSNQVSIISGVTGVNTYSVSNVTVGLSPSAVAINPVTNMVYVTDQTANTVSVINGSTGSVLSSTIPVGANPLAVAVNSVTNAIYVVNQAGDSVSVIDGATNAVTATIPVGQGPEALAVNEETNTIYVANTTDGTVSVIDGATNTVSNIFAVGTDPNVMAINPVTNTLYVANTGTSLSADGTVSVIDCSTNSTATVAAGTGPAAAAVNQITNTVYVPNSLDNTVSVINGATVVVSSTVTVGSAPQAVAVNPVTDTVYVTNSLDNTVSAIDGATSTVSATVAVGSAPQAIAVNPATDQVYVANSGSSSVSVLNGATNAISATVTVGTTPQAVAVNPVTNTVYVANHDSGTVSAISGMTNAVANITVGASPSAVAVNPATNTIYVANYGSRSISIINGSTNAVTTGVTVGSGPFAVAVNRQTNTIYVANQIDGTVSVIDGATNTVTTTISVGSNPYALTVNLLLNLVYVANQGGNTVSVINGSTNVVSSVTVGSNPQAVALDAITGEVYVANFGSNNISVITPSAVGTVPLTTIIAAVSDSQTVSTLNLFQTTNPTPSFTATVTSAYSTTATYDASSATNPIPTALYYQVNGGSAWTPVSPTSSANPATFTITPAIQQVGLNILYVYAAYGDEGTPASSGNGSGNSPEIGNITAIPFLIEPVSTTTTLTADYSSQSTSVAVNFTASVTPVASSATSATGTVTFTSTSSLGVVTTLCHNVAVVYTAAVTGSPSAAATNHATCAASFATADTYTIAATFTGTQNYGSSTMTRTETIGTSVLYPPVITAISPSGGPLTSGTTVTITGTNFTNATAVAFGSTTAASFTVITATEITAVAPPGVPGIVDITVTTSSTSATSPADQYTYTAPSSDSAPSTLVGSTATNLTAYVTMTTAGTSASSSAAAVQVLTQGATGQDFNFLSGGTCAANTAYAVGQVCTVEYSFTPMHPWARYGGIEVVSTTGAVLGNTFVHGTGNGPQAAFSLSTPTTPVTLGGGFHGPTGIALDAVGNIFVADLNNNTVYEMLAAGGYTTIKTLGGGFDGPSTVAIDGSGNIYIANANDETVSEMPPGCASAACVTTLGGGFTRPAGIAVDGNGNVYVADYNNQEVTEMPPNCFSTRCMTSLGGGFKNPRDVAVDGNGNVYVVDPVNVALTRMPAGCTNVSCVTTLGDGFSSPEGVAVDGAGNAYVADQNNSSLKEIAPTCFSASCVVTLGGSFSFPVGVALDGSENIYVINQFYNSVQRLDVQHAPSLSFAGTAASSNSAPQVVTLGNNGNLPLTISALTATSANLSDGTTCNINAAVAAGAGCSLAIEFIPAAQGSQNTGSVSITDNTLNDNPNLTQTVGLSGAGLGSGSGAQTISFPAPPSPMQYGVPPVALGATASSGLAVSYAVTGPATVSGSMLTINGAGTVTIIASQNGNSIYAAAAPVTRSIFVSGGPILNVGTSSGPLTATMYFTSTGTLNSTLSTAIQVVTQGATGLDFNYVSGGTCIPGMAYVPSTTCTVKYTFTPTRPWMRNGGIQLLNSARLSVSSTYVSGMGDSAQTTFARSTPAVPISLGGGFVNPWGIAVDGNGNVYVGDAGKFVTNTGPGNGSVYEILAAGGYTTIKTLGGIYAYPDGLAVDGIGNVYVTDAGNSTVREIPHGCLSSGCVVQLGGDFRQPLGIAVDQSGNVYVADIAATVTEMPPNCFNSSCMTILGGGFAQPYGVAVDAGGNVYVADHYTSVVSVMPAGCISASCVVPLGGGFNSPDGMTVDGSGNVYVTEPNKISKMPPGCFTADCVTTLHNGLGYPLGIALDGGGNIFFAESGKASVDKIDVQTPPSLSFVSTSFGTPSAPQFVTLGNNGNLPLAISALTLTNANLDSGTTCTTSSAVAPGAACGLGVKFMPTTIAGSLSGSVSINDNELYNSGETQVIGLTGSVVQQMPTLTLASVATVGYGSNSLLRSSLSWTGAGAAPTGAVTFSVDNGTPLATSCIGTATPITCTYAGSFAVGSHTLNASYAGDSNYAGAAATPGSFIVVADASRLVFGTPPATPLTAGGNGGSAISVLEENPSSSVVPTATDPITLTVTGPVGSVTKTYGPTNAIAGVASFNVSADALAVPGTYTYTATFGSLTSAVASETVNSAVSTTTTLSSTTLTESHPTTAFMPVTGAGGTGTLTYRVLPVLPTGLSFSSTGVVSGTPTVISAAATYAVTVTDASGSTSTATFSLAVKQASQTTVSVSAAATSPEQTVTLTATVTSTIPGTTVMPSGMVTFYANGTLLMSEPVSVGVAQLTTLLPDGATAVITATYAGDGNFLGSISSNGASVAVGSLDFTFTNTGAAAYTAAPGAVATYDFALAPLYGSYAGTVSFRVTGLPAGATASFTPSMVAVGGGPAPVVMTVQTAAAIAQNHDLPFGRSIHLALLFLPLLSKRRVREKLRSRMLLPVLLMAGLTATLNGCGSQNGFLLQSPRAAPLTVTASGGTLQHSQTVTLIVQ